MPAPQTIYANIVNVQTTQNELILDFGCVFRVQEQQQGPTEFEPQIRVILLTGVAKAFGELLLRATQSTQEASNDSETAEKA